MQSWQHEHAVFASLGVVTLVFDVSGYVSEGTNMSFDMFPGGSSCLEVQMMLGTSGDVPEGTDTPFGMSRVSFGCVDVSQGQ